MAPFVMMSWYFICNSHPVTLITFKAIQNCEVLIMKSGIPI